MGLKFYSIDSMPSPGDIVWCKWPQKEDKLGPGAVVRAVLVRQTEVRESNGQQFGTVLISYGTGNVKPGDEEIDLVIGSYEFRSLGLHKSTRFSLRLSDKRQLPWCEDYFVTQGYVRSQNLIAGCLTQAHFEKMKRCLEVRKSRKLH